MPPTIRVATKCWGQSLPAEGTNRELYGVVHLGKAGSKVPNAVDARRNLLKVRFVTHLD
jgi:hypothetical protein